MDERDPLPGEGAERPSDPAEPVELGGEETSAPDDRRRFLKGLITGAAVATIGAAGSAGVASAQSCGRKLPLSAPPGAPSTLTFASDLAAIGGITPTEWTQVEDKMQQYLGPLVDTSGYLGASYSITIRDCITITGSA